MVSQVLSFNYQILETYWNKEVQRILSNLLLLMRCDILDLKKLPVLVDFNAVGSMVGSKLEHSGELLAKRQNIIVIQVQFRVGIYGFYFEKKKKVYY